MTSFPTSSSSSRSKGRRCPKCRRRLTFYALSCYHCNWQVPFKPVIMLLIAVGVGLLGTGIYLGVGKALGGGPNTPNIKHATTDIHH